MNKKYTLALIALCSMGGTFAQSLTQAKQWFEEWQVCRSQTRFPEISKTGSIECKLQFLVRSMLL